MTRILLALTLVFTAFGASAEAVIPAPPQINAKAWLLMDAATGKVLAEQDADLPLPPASLTKLMTSYIMAAEMEAGRIKADDLVNVSVNAWSQNPKFAGSSLMWIEPGMEVTVREIERGIIISSGNDATVAAAEHLAGSEAAFADLMNSYAEKLGMQDTFYVNSHGLPDPQHLTTARDLALLAAATTRLDPEYYGMYKEREFTFNNITQYNRNSLLAQDPSVDGLKTGYTAEAGYCLVASAERRGMRLVSVVLGAKSPRSRAAESSTLLNYGFRFFETAALFGDNEVLDEVRVWKGTQDQLQVGIQDGVVATLLRGKAGDLQREVQLQPQLVAPLAMGDAVGEVVVSLDGETVYRGPVVALQAVEEAGFFARLWDTLLMWLAKLFSA